MERGEATLGDNMLESGRTSICSTHSSQMITPCKIEIQNIGACVIVSCALDRVHQFVNGVQFLNRHMLHHDTEHILDQMEAW